MRVEYNNMKDNIMNNLILRIKSKNDDNILIKYLNINYIFT